MMENKEDYKIYSTVEKQEVEWLWYPYIPYGKLTLLQGDLGDGKSTFMINIASALTRGRLLPDGKNDSEFSSKASCVRSTSGVHAF